MSTAFHPLRIAEVRRETSDSVSLRFELPDDLRPLFAFRAGQHLTLRTEIDGEDVRRNYSVCVSPADGELRVAIKHIAGGVFSHWANAQLALGGRDADGVVPPDVLAVDLGAQRQVLTGAEAEQGLQVLRHLEAQRDGVGGLPPHLGDPERMEGGAHALSGT